MQDLHIALRHEAPIAKGEGIPVARVGALKVLRTWVLRTSTGLFPPPNSRRRSSLFQSGAHMLHLQTSRGQSVGF
jgi:hypothetical protein